MQMQRARILIRLEDTGQVQWCMQRERRNEKILNNETGKSGPDRYNLQQSTIHDQQRRGKA